MPKLQPVDSPPVKVQGSHRLICVVEPYVCAELMVWGQIVLVPALHLPRNLNETRLGFIHSKEDGVEGIGTSGLDLEAVLFVRSPVLQAKQRVEMEELGTKHLALGAILRSHLLLMHCVTVRSTFAA